MNGIRVGSEAYKTSRGHERVTILEGYRHPLLRESGERTENGMRDSGKVREKEDR